MQAIFTNVKGEVNLGTVLDIHPDGLVNIRWQPFTQLIDRILSKSQGQRDIVMESLGDRTGWSRPYAKTEFGDSLIIAPETGDSPELTAKFEMFGKVTA